MKRRCSEKDTKKIYEIINEAATAYDGAIPADCYHQPYMPMTELESEMKRVTFYGWETAPDGLVGVMGLEPVKDVTLIRHAYVLTKYQGRGIGGKLLGRLISETATPRLLVGTWAGATWAVVFYERHGFKLVADKEEKDRLLKKYWDISARQIETSVVLELKVKTGVKG